MFHRVKSESETQSNQQTETAEQSNTQSESVVRNSSQQQPEAQAKETQSMTQTADTREDAKTDTSAYVAPTGYRTSVAESKPSSYTPSYAPHNAAEAAKQKAEEAPEVEEVVEATAPAVSQAVEGSQLVIGRGITMSGEIEHCDTLVVEGTVEAALKGANSLEIAESGVFYGAVNIKDATISGRFEGDITVNGRLSITSTGVVTGSIAYGELEIEGGAVIEGKISPVKAQAAQKQEKTQAAREAAALARARELSQETASQLEAANAQEGQLFSSRS